MLTGGTEGGKLRGHERGKTQEDSTQELFAWESAMQETMRAYSTLSLDLRTVSLQPSSDFSAHWNVSRVPTE